MYFALQFYHYVQIETLKKLKNWAQTAVLKLVRGAAYQHDGPQPALGHQ